MSDLSFTQSEITSFVESCPKDAFLKYSKENRIAWVTFVASVDEDAKSQHDVLFYGCVARLLGEVFGSLSSVDFSDLDCRDQVKSLIVAGTQPFDAEGEHETLREWKVSPDHCSLALRVVEAAIEKHSDKSTGGSKTDQTTMQVEYPTWFLWLCFTVPVWLLGAVHMSFGQFEDRLSMLTELVDARGKNIDALAESISRLKKDMDQRESEPSYGRRDPYRFKNSYPRRNSYSSSYRDPYGFENLNRYNDPYGLKYSHKYNDPYNDPYGLKNSHKYNDPYSDNVWSREDRQDAGSRYRSSSIWDKYKVAHAETSSVAGKLDTSGAGSSLSNEVKKRYLEKLKGKDYESLVNDLARLKSLDGQDSYEGEEYYNSFSDSAIDWDQHKSGIKCNAKTKKGCSKKEIKYINKQAYKSRIELSSEYLRLWDAKTASSSFSENEWRKKQIAILSTLMAEVDEREYYTPRAAAEGEEYYKNVDPYKADHNWLETYLSDYKGKGAEAYGCDTKTQIGCSDKEKEYIGKQQDKSPEKVAAELKRLEGMKDKEMSEDKKKWLHQRLQILKDLTN